LQSSYLFFKEKIEPNTQRCPTPKHVVGGAQEILQILLRTCHLGNIAATTPEGSGSRYWVYHLVLAYQFIEHVSVVVLGLMNQTEISAPGHRRHNGQPQNSGPQHLRRVIGSAHGLAVGLVFGSFVSGLPRITTVICKSQYGNSGNETEANET